MEKILEEFRGYLLFERGLAKVSINHYLGDLQLLAKKYDLLKLNVDDIRSYIKGLHDDGALPPTIKRKLAAFRLFYNHLLQIKMIEVNPMLKIETGKSIRTLPVVFSAEEFNLLLESCRDSKYYYRDKMILELLYSCGLRVSEFISLSPNDINLEEKILKCQGKGSKQRLIPLGEMAVIAIKEYLASIKTKGGRNQFLLATNNGKKYSRKQIYDIIKWHQYNSGIAKNISPHTFRHSAATVLLENGADLKSVQEFLGHQDITTTQIYTHVSTKNLKDAINKFHPRGGKKEN